MIVNQPHIECVPLPPCGKKRGGGQEKGRRTFFEPACTPDLFLFDGGRRLFYRGQLDDSRPRNGVPVTGRDLRAALDALLAGQPAPQPQKPSIGCNIKWKPGNEPAYFVG